MFLKKIIIKVKNFYFRRLELLQIVNQFKNIGFKKKILIIASSNSSLKLNKGPKVDKFDYIVRFNGAPTKNFENIIGSKTNMMCVSEKLFKKKCKLIDSKFLDELYLKDIFVVLEHSINNDYNYSEIEKKNNIIFFPNYLNHYLRFLTFSKFNLFKKIYYFIYGKKMSIGLIMIKIFTFAGFKVHIFGFDLNKNKDNYTYYFNDRVKSLTKAHDWKQENKIISRMLKNKEIFLL